MQLRKKFSYILFMLCFMTSFVCFVDSKPDDPMSLFAATNSAGQIYTMGCSISNSDMCTVEMLRNTHTRLLNCQTSVKNNELRRKTDTPFEGPMDILSLPSWFHVFASAIPLMIADHTGHAEIIHFIHHKDGKKRI